MAKPGRSGRCLPVLALVLALTLTLVPPAAAQPVDWSLSGFATLGFAISDSNQTYLRHIDDTGTIKADSLLGAQLDISSTTGWGRIGATVQGLLTAPEDRDDGMAGKLSWAFVSWRPDNDWLIRLGKIRAATLIHTQNMDVGVTYDQLRLPAEFYSLSPVYDMWGGTAMHTWQRSDAEITLEGYVGYSRVYSRYAWSDGSVHYYDHDMILGGVVASYVLPRLTLRASLNLGRLFSPDGSDIYPDGIGSSDIAGETLYFYDGLRHSAGIGAVTVGLDWQIDDGWRLTAEYGARRLDVANGRNSHGAYVTLARRLGAWTPYISLAGLTSDGDILDWYGTIDGSPVPALSGLGSSYHSEVANTLGAYEQASLMLGASYSLSPTTRIKAEWMHTRVGTASSLFDGGFSGGSANVFSLAVAKSF